MVVVGAIGSPERAYVDDAGVVAVPELDGLTVRWTIGTGDKWHDPREKANVRQTLLDFAPIVETRMRVEGGDILHRCFVVEGIAGPMLIIEVRNDSSTPVALAVHLMATGLDAVDAVVDGFSIDGVGRLWFDRNPGELRSGTDPSPSGAREHSAHFPLPHTITRQFVVPLGKAASNLHGFPSVVPDAAAVAKGWEAHGSRGLRMELPPGRLTEAVGVTRRSMLLQSHGERFSPAIEDHGWPGIAASVRAFSLFGLHDECGAVLARLGFVDTRDPGLVPALVALGDHVALSGDADLAEALVEVVAGIAHRLHRTQKKGKLTDVAWAAAAFRGAEITLAAAGQHKAAADAHADTDRTGVAVRSPIDLLSDTSPEVAVFVDLRARIAMGDAGGLADLDTLLNTQAPTFAWNDPFVAAAFCETARALVVDESEQGLNLFPVWPRMWFGQGAEVFEAPTVHGLVSFAIRWHGDRPALLWDLVPHEHSATAASPPVLRCSGLDPAWSSLELRGETLLAQPDPSGP